MIAARPKKNANTHSGTPATVEPTKSDANPADKTGTESTPNFTQNVSFSCLMP